MRRGGSQGGFSFDSQERRTYDAGPFGSRIKKPVIMTSKDTIALQIHARLAAARRPLLVAHKKPDGDTLGAMMAVYSWLRDQGREAYAFCLDVPARAYAYVPRLHELQTDPRVFEDEAVDLICVFDAGDLAYAGIEDFVKAMPDRPFIVNFDHHVTNLRFGDLNLLVTDASSTAEVVHGFLEAGGVGISRPMAVCLMTGILTDTSNFSNPATTVNSLRVASELLLKGASIQEITRHLMRNKPVSSLKIWGKALERLRWDAEARTVSTALYLEDFKDHTSQEEYVEGLSNFLNHLLDAQVVLVLKELPDGKVKGSYRSASDVDVAALAQKYGGGGHKKAAGFTVAGKIVEAERGWKVDPAP
jgi:phosphoesterase RecJ-like protein